MSKSDLIRENDRRQRAFACAFGLWLALALLKMGAPVILDDKTTPPADLLEVLLLSWPVRWGYLVLALVIVLAVPSLRWSLPRPRWVLLLPLLWLVWQLISAAQTVEPALTRPAVSHFIACVAAFYIGLFGLSQIHDLRLFWGMLLGGFALVLAVGWHQHFIGLEETRRYFFEQPNWREYPPEFLKKIASNRIYATLFYPNALAGVIVLLAPVWLYMLWHLTGGWASAGRTVVVLAGVLPPVACLIWSGSKGGWLILVAAGAIGLWRSPLPRRWRTYILLATVGAGLAGFVFRYSAYLAAGATSATARTVYWKAGVALAVEKPLLGSGPGTFMIGYRRLKAPGDEMTRLAHNDYLQQASDSGIPGFLLFAALVFGSLAVLYRKSSSDASGASFAVWLGLAAFAAQSCVEFGLYIPALAWTFFALLGWSSGYSRRGNPFDNLGNPR